MHIYLLPGLNCYSCNYIGTFSSESSVQGLFDSYAENEPKCSIGEDATKLQPVTCPPVSNGMVAMCSKFDGRGIASYLSGESCGRLKYTSPSKLLHAFILIRAISTFALYPYHSASCMDKLGSQILWDVRRLVLALSYYRSYSSLFINKFALIVHVTSCIQR